MSKIKDIFNPDYNAYGERNLVNLCNNSDNQNSKGQITLNDMIQYNYPKSGLGSVKSILDYSANRDTVFFCKNL